jgi:hypothetical protein
MGNGMRERINWPIKSGSKTEVSERGREAGDRLIEPVPEFEVSEREREVIHLLVKTHTEHKMREVRRQRVERVVERGIVISTDMSLNLIDWVEFSTSTKGKVGEGEGEIVYFVAKIISKY